MALIKQAGISLYTFILGALAIFLSLYFNFTTKNNSISIIFIYLLCAAVYNVILVLTFSSKRDSFNYKYNYNYKIAVRAGNLGVAFAGGILISLLGGSWSIFGWYFAALTFFHWSEYFTTAATNPRALALDSFLLDHSREYQLAALASWTEFTVEWFFFPEMKQVRVLNLLGLALIVGGEVLRKTSMITAGHSFNHYVQHMRQQDHVLVTSGVYGLFRHPAYVGWFYWSIGTQIMLCNPFCLIGYTIVSWRFFNERIYEEELYLLNFFGEDYAEYQKRVGAGLPLIKGFNRQS